MRHACGSLTAGCGLTNSSLRLSPMRGASGLASSPVSRGERKRGRRKNFLVLLGLVVAVHALFSDKFQQSKEFYRFVPQIQFISRVWDIPVVEQRQVRTVLNFAEDGRFVRCSFWSMLTRPLLCNDRDMVRQCRKPCWCRSCSSSKVDGLPSCRRGKSPWSCVFRKPQRLRSCSRHSPSLDTHGGSAQLSAPPQPPQQPQQPHQPQPQPQPQQDQPQPQPPPPQQQPRQPRQWLPRLCLAQDRLMKSQQTLLVQHVPAQRNRERPTPHEATSRTSTQIGSLDSGAAHATCCALGEATRGHIAVTALVHAAAQSCMCNKLA